MLELLAALALVTAAAPPATLATAAGQVVGLTQDAGRVAWLESTASGCRLVVRSAGGKRTALRYAPGGCLPPPPAYDLALASKQAAWGGYTEVRCSEFTAAVYAATASRAHLIEEIPGDCLGYRTSFQGLVTDGRRFYYALIDTRPPGDPSQRCGEGRGCHWQLASGRVKQIVGNQGLPVPGLPAAALIAGAPGHLALVQPAARGSSGGAIDWPRAASGGTVQVFDTADRHVAATFRPPGRVRAVALSPTRCVVLVESQGNRRFVWYDARSGKRLGSAAAPPGTASSLSTDGRYVAFAAGKRVRVLDLASSAQRTLRTASTPPVGVSVSAGRVVWAEGRRILTATA